MRVGCQVIAPTLIPTAQGPGQDRQPATADGWLGCTTLGNWWASASRPWPRRQCGTYGAPERICSPTAPELGIAWEGA